MPGRTKGVDIVADIERGLPFANAGIDSVFAAHFLEHVRDLRGLLREIHRVLKPHGAVHVMVPSASHPNAVADPTHVRFFNLATFRYFCEPHPGWPLFRPLCASETPDNLLVDLQPLPAGHVPAHAGKLAFFFG